MSPEEAAALEKQLSRLLDAVNAEINAREAFKNTVFDHVDTDIRETLTFVRALVKGDVNLPPASVTGP